MTLVGVTTPVLMYGVFDNFFYQCKKCGKVKKKVWTIMNQTTLFLLGVLCGMIATIPIYWLVDKIYNGAV